MGEQAALPLPTEPPSSGGCRDSNEETLALLALSLIPGMSVSRLQAVAKQGIGFVDVVRKPTAEGVRDTLRGCGVAGAAKIAQEVVTGRHAAYRDARDLLVRLRERGIECIHSWDARFPKHLKHTPDAPEWLFVEGDTGILCRPSVAIVGTRRPTPDGIFLTDCVCYSLRGTDVVVASGLAAGIDSRAHYTANVVGLPNVAVLGTGIFRDYPTNSAELRQSIIRKGGAVVSEYFPNDGPRKDRFVRRNRIQAGLARVTMPIEWSLTGGTAHTVRFAIGYNRPLVGVVVANKEDDETRFLRAHNAPVFMLPQQSDMLIEGISTLLADS